MCSDAKVVFQWAYRGERRDSAVWAKTLINNFPPSDEDLHEAQSTAWRALERFTGAFGRL